jgi:phosphate transport system substrate-binding protein
MKKTLILTVLIGALVAAYFLFGKEGGENTETQQKDSIVIKGSDTEVQLVSNLVEAFLEKNQGADISVTGGGSGVGIAALLNGEIDLANSSRPMTEAEFKTAQEKNLQVQEFVLARDGLSVVVHPSNPLTKISLEDISKIYQGKITNWKELGGPDSKIVLYGRQSTSGTYVFFRDTVVKGDYFSAMLNMEGTQAIVDSVKADVSGIGYAGVGYIVDSEGKARTDIKILDVSTDVSGPAISPLDKEAVAQGKYPIYRPIYQYLASVPGKDSLHEKFIRFEASEEGQGIVEKSGFYSTSVVDEEQNNALFEKIK